MLSRLTQTGPFSHHYRLLSIASLMLFFYALFNGLISYILPIRITDLGFSTSQMGLILASSNVFGAIFDFFLAKFIRNTNYRRLYLIAYGLCFVYPLILWPSHTLPWFMLSMAIWGLYGDLHLYATFDFVARRSRFDDHCKNFGILGVFSSLGYLIAPIIAGIIAVGVIDIFPFSLSISFILITAIFYILLVQFSPRKDSPNYDHHLHYHHHNFFKELSIVTKIAQVIRPVIIFSILTYVFDAVFWTIGPIFSESFTNFKNFGGYFMAAYTLPVLIVNWFVTPIVKRFGKKRTAYLSFLFSSLFLIPIGITTSPVLIIILVFISSMFGSIAWPAIDGAFADYISESGSYERELESLTDFSCNVGYIIGPIFAGITAELVSNRLVFPIIAFFNIAVVLILLKVTPKHIHVAIHRH